MPKSKKKHAITLGKNVRRDSRGRLLKGSIINPNGISGLLGIDELIDALNNEALRKKLPDFNTYVARRAFRNSQVLITVLKKIYPDKVEHSGKVTFTPQERDEKFNRLKALGVLSLN